MLERVAQEHRAWLQQQAAVMVLDYKAKFDQDEIAKQDYERQRAAYAEQLDLQWCGGGRHLLEHALHFYGSNNLIQDALRWSGGPLSASTRTQCIVNGRQ